MVKETELQTVLLISLVRGNGAGNSTANATGSNQTNGAGKFPEFNNNAPVYAPAAVAPVQK